MLNKLFVFFVIFLQVSNLAYAAGKGVGTPNPSTWRDEITIRPIPTFEPDPYTDMPLNEGAFLWKRQLSMNGHDLEHEHSILFSHVDEFRQKLNHLSDPELLDHVKFALLDRGIRHEHQSKFIEIFQSLYSKDHGTVRSYMKQIHKQHPENNIYKSINMALDLPEVQQIIMSNFNKLKRLQEGRNLCTASFSIIDPRSGTTPVTLPIGLKPNRMTIFFSGVTNQLIRILAIHRDFQKWDYVFLERDRRDNSIVRLNTGLLDTPSSTINLAHNLYGCFGHGMEYVEQPLLNRHSKECKEGVEACITTAEEISHAKAGSASESEARDVAMSQLLKKYAHSEQALRLFLLERIGQLLQRISFDHHKILVLNLYTERDPCPACTHCLFLETHMHDHNPQVSYSSGKAYGFFQEFNSKLLPQTEDGRFNPDHIPSPYILVSSSKLEGQEGITKRLLSGVRDLDTPIEHPHPTRLFFRYNGPFLSEDIRRLFIQHFESIASHSSKRK